MVVETARIGLEGFDQEQWESFKSQLHPKGIFTQRDSGNVREGVEEVCSSFHSWRVGHKELRGQITDGFW
jgi:hypothetical protein